MSTAKPVHRRFKPLGVDLAPGPAHEPGAKDLGVTPEAHEADRLEVVKDVGVRQQLLRQHAGEEHDGEVVLRYLVRHSCHRSPEGWVVLIWWDDTYHLIGEDVSVEQDGTGDAPCEPGTNGRLPGARCAGDYEERGPGEGTLVTASRAAQDGAVRGDLGQVAAGAAGVTGERHVGRS
jgi:hypothetical protein